MQVFIYKTHQVRTSEVDGEIWFVAIDVANVLELTNVTEALRGLDEEERSTLRITEGISPKGGNPNMNVISEAGLYKLIFNSRKPEAKAFTHWVTHEVLPSIRKTGSYSIAAKSTVVFDPMQSAKIIFEVAGIRDNQLALALDNVHKSYTGRSALEAGEITLTAPTKNQLLTPTEIGSHFGLKAHRVNEILAGAGYQHKLNGKWEALPPGDPYAVMQDTGKRHSNGTPVRQLKWNSEILRVFEELQTA